MQTEARAAHVRFRARLRRLDEAFLYESSIDRTTFDIDSALAKAISVLDNAAAL